MIRASAIRGCLAKMLAALLMITAPSIHAQDRPPDLLLDEILVTGEQPGPALWKVKKDDHTLWIVGTLVPLPAKMTWRSREVEAVVKNSSEILGPISGRGTLKHGIFTGIRLLPSVMRLRRSPDGAKLREILPQDLHARWVASYHRYFGKNPGDGEEKLRPMFAGQALYERALNQSGLSGTSIVWPTVEKLAKRHSVPVRTKDFKILLDDPKGIIEEIAAMPRDKDIACMASILDRIEKDIPQMQRTARAWAVGDITTLRASQQVDFAPTCMEALLSGGEGVRAIFDQTRKLVQDDWQNIAIYMLLAHENSLAALPLSDLFSDSGMLAKLRAKGYVVEEPK